MLNTLCAFCLILLCFLSIHLYNKIIQNQYNLNLIEKHKALEKKGLESQEVAESYCNECLLETNFEVIRCREIY